MGTPRGEPQRFFRETVLSYRDDECLFWPYSKDGHGYGQIWRDGTHRNVHRLVCEHVNGPPPTEKHQAAHSCGKGASGCVNPQHLSWKTQSGNEADKIAHGTHSRGERHGSAKLTEADAIAIKALQGKLTHREIAARFGVSMSAVRRIHVGVTWTHIFTDRRAA